MIKYSVINGQQIIKEVCEHCGEEVQDLHISEITVKSPKDPRTIRIVGIDGVTKQLVPLKADFIADKTGSYIAQGLLDEREELKYGVRPEAMCSMSIDTVAGTTSSFCYRTDNVLFLAKHSASFHDANELESTDAGRKVGVDRKGRVIRMKAEKPINIRTRKIKTKANGDEEDIKYHGQFEVSWFRALRPALQKSYLETAQRCSYMVKRYGDEVKNGSVMSRFKSADAFKTEIDRNC
mgnify:CR=1 FL=1